MDASNPILEYANKKVFPFYNDLATILIISIISFILIVPIFTIGASMIAAHKVVNDVYDGNYSSEKERIKAMIENFSQNLVRGLPISIILVITVFTELIYIWIALTTYSDLFFILSSVGLYLVIVSFSILLRTSNIMSQDPSFTFVDAFLHSVLITSSNKKLYIKHIGRMVIIVFVCIVIPIFGFILLPGVLYIMEVRSYKTIVTNQDITSLKTSGG